MTILQATIVILAYLLFGLLGLAGYIYNIEYEARQKRLENLKYIGWWVGGGK